MDTITKASEQEIIRLFRADKTVREIAEATKIDKREILLHLTKLGLWSKYCSECVLKRCYDCKGLSELGQPIGVQDQIDLIVELKRMKDDSKDTR